MATKQGATDQFSTFQMGLEQDAAAEHDYRNDSDDDDESDRAGRLTELSRQF